MFPTAHQGLFSTVSVGIPLVVSNSFSGIISLDCRTFGFSVAFRECLEALIAGFI
jgi:hypothetical protein